MNNINITDRALVTVNGAPFGAPGMVFSKVFSKSEAEEIVEIFKSVDTITNGEADTGVKMQYLTNQEYLVLVKFGLQLNAPLGVFDVENLKKGVEVLRKTYAELAEVTPTLKEV